MDRRILITGGAGFIGSHLCQRFINEEDYVIAVDNLSTVSDTGNIAHLIGHPKFTFIEHDIIYPKNYEGPFDYILHFACPASPKHYKNLAIETLKVGAIGSMNMLELAKEKGARILVASTSEVYGNPNNDSDVQCEEYNGNVSPIGPRSMYDEAKRYMEALTMAYHDKHGVDTRIVRIFNTYGPNMDVNDGRVLPNFAQQALTGKPLTLFGTGQQKRSFCYIDDLVEGIYRLLFSDYYMPVNIGNGNEGEEITIEIFARDILELTGSKSVIEYIPEEKDKDDPERRCPDITKAKEILGWEPKVSRRQGLTSTIEYFRGRV